MLGAARNLTFRRKPHLRQQFPPHKIATWACLLVISAGITLGWIMMLRAADANITTIVQGLLPATLAAIAVIYGAYHAFWSQKVRLTLDLVSQRFANPVYDAHAKAFNEAKRASSPIGPHTRLKDLQTMKVGTGTLLDAMAHLYNFWEFAATAYASHNIDRATFEDMASDLIIDLLEPLPGFIGEVRSIDPTNWEYLCALFYLFANETKKQAAIEKMGQAPRILSPHDRHVWEHRYRGRAATRDYLNA